MTANSNRRRPLPAGVARRVAGVCGSATDDATDMAGPPGEDRQCGAATVRASPRAVIAASTGLALRAATDSHAGAAALEWADEAALAGGGGGVGHDGGARADRRRAGR